MTVFPCTLLKNLFKYDHSDKIYATSSKKKKYKELSVLNIVMFVTESVAYK